MPADDGDLSFRKALDYMGLEAGSADAGYSRRRRLCRQLHQFYVMSDLRRTAADDPERATRWPTRCACWSFRGPNPSSSRPKPRVWMKFFTAAGAEWRESGCSMCLGMNGDVVPAGQAVRQHQQSQFRRPSGCRRAHGTCQPADRSGIGRFGRAKLPTRGRCLRNPDQYRQYRFKDLSMEKVANESTPRTVVMTAG